MARTVIGRHRTEVVLLICLFVLPFAFFIPFIARPHTIPFPRSSLGTDILPNHVPNGTFVSRAFWNEGTLPFWRPTILLGVPFLGNPTSLMFYPFYWLIGLLPLARAVTLLLVFHLGVMTTGMYAFARYSLQMSPWAAFVAACSFGLGYKTLSHVAGGHVDVLSALAWMPWTFLFIHRHFAQGEVRWAALTGLLLAFSLLSHPPTALLHAIGDVLYATFVWVSTLVKRSDGRWCRRQWRGLCLSLVPVLALTLSAVQILPMIALLPWASRSTLSMTEANQYALPLSLLPTVFLPTPLQFPEWATYLGVSPIALLPAAFLVRRPRGTTWFFGGIVVLSGVLSLGSGTPLYILAYRFLPGLSWLRVPTRFWFLTAFSAALLAGQGLDAVCSSLVVHRRVLRAIWALEILLYSIASVLIFAISDEWRSEIASVSCLLVPLLAWYWIRSVRAKADGMCGVWFIVAPLLVAVLLDITWQRGLLLEPVSVNQFLHPSPAERYLDSQSGIWRVYGVGGTLSPAVAAVYGFERLEGAEPFHPVYLARLINQAAGCTHASYSGILPVCMSGAIDPKAYLDAVPDIRKLGLLNVRYLVTDFALEATDLTLLADWDGLRLYENRRVLPRAFVVGRVDVLTDHEQVWDRLQEVDPARVALVAEPLPGALNTDMAPQEAQVIDQSSDALHLRVNLDRAGMLVISQTWAPGWQATDNGRPLPLYRTDYALQGAYLEAGAHGIVLTYRPSSWRWGLMLTVGGLAICVLCVAFSHPTMPAEAARTRSRVYGRD